VIISDRVFRKMNGSVITSITSAQKVYLGRSVFSRLRDLSISNVPKLEIIEETFSEDSTKKSGHGYAAKVRLQCF